MQKSNIYEASDGTHIWYGTVGQGPPLVLCDGLACDGFIWPYVIDDFCERFTVIRWHYRGHGRSGDPANAGRLTVQDLCQDLRGILDELQLHEEVILAGHSMGVQLILQYAQLFPRQISALIPICGSYGRPLDTFHNSTVLKDALPYLERLVDWAPERLQRLWSTLAPQRFWYLLARRGELNPRLIQPSDFFPYLEHAGQMDLRIFLHVLRNLSEHDCGPFLEELQAPTLIIAAEHDTFTPLSRSLEMHERLPDSELVVLPGASHAGPLELPDAVNNAIYHCLERRGLMPREPVAQGEEGRLR